MSRWRGVLLAGLAAIPGSTQGQTPDGNTFLASCRAAAAAEISYEAMMCGMYVAGYVAGHRAYEKALASVGKPAICMAPETPPTQAIETLVAYMTKHPDRLHEPFHVVLTRALLGAFPCE